jgi:2'-5' RNA ligase
VEPQTRGRAARVEKIHLTLVFLGDADERKAIEAGRGVAGRAHELPIEQASYWRHNQIVWAGPRETPAPLTALVEALQVQLYKREFIMERRAFAAHVTLLRKARAPANPPALPAVAWPVREFLLVKSEGSKYTPLERFALGERCADS